MAVDVDYYAVIGVDRRADKEAIEAGVKKSMREWRKRTEAADLSVRQEAEVKVKLIEGARMTLLDPARRAAYDRELATGVREKTPVAAGAGAGAGDVTWLERAEGYLGIGDYQSAAYAAREATQLEGNNARTWWVRSRANAGLNRLDDALYEATQAVEIEGSNAEYHFNLGVVNESMGRADAAIREYRVAAGLDPDRPIYELSIAGVLLQRNQVDQALPVIEDVYRRFPHDETANYYLGMALLDKAESIPRKRQGDMYFVSSAQEITQMRVLVERAKRLNIVDDDVRRNADQILGYLAKMEERAWRPPRQLISGALGAGAEGGCGLMVIMLGLVIGLILLPVILVFVGFSMMFSGDSAGAGFVCLLIGAGLGWIWYKVSYIPRWKHNRKDA